MKMYTNSVLLKKKENIQKAKKNSYWTHVLDLKKIKVNTLYDFATATVKITKRDNEAWFWALERWELKP